MLPLTAPLADVDPNSVRPGWVALLVVLGLAVATFLLWRNMGKQMRKIDFDETMTGEPRPLRRRLKARRMMLATSLPLVIGSECLATCAMASVELKLGGTWAMRRG